MNEKFKRPHALNYLTDYSDKALLTMGVATLIELRGYIATVAEGAATDWLLSLDEVEELNGAIDSVVELTHSGNSMNWKYRIYVKFIENMVERIEARQEDEGWCQIGCGGI